MAETTIPATAPEERPLCDPDPEVDPEGVIGRALDVGDAEVVVVCVIRIGGNSS